MGLLLIPSVSWVSGRDELTFMKRTETNQTEIKIVVEVIARARG